MTQTYNFFNRSARYVHLEKDMQCAAIGKCQTLCVGDGLKRWRTAVSKFSSLFLFHNLCMYVFSIFYLIFSFLIHVDMASLRSSLMQSLLYVAGLLGFVMVMAAPFIESKIKVGPAPTLIYPQLGSSDFFHSGYHFGT